MFDFLNCEYWVEGFLFGGYVFEFAFVVVDDVFDDAVDVDGHLVGVVEEDLAGASVFDGHEDLAVEFAVVDELFVFGVEGFLDLGVVEFFWEGVFGDGVEFGLHFGGGDLNCGELYFFGFAGVEAGFGVEGLDHGLGFGGLAEVVDDDRFEVFDAEAVLVTGDRSGQGVGYGAVAGFAGGEGEDVGWDAFLVGVGDVA